MKAIVLTSFLAFSFQVAVLAEEPIEINLECEASGIQFTGEKSATTILESLYIIRKKVTGFRKSNRQGKSGIKYIKVEYSSNSIELSTQLIYLSADLAVISATTFVGTDSSVKLLVFTNAIDLKSMISDRIVSSVPSGLDERTRSICRQKEQGVIEDIKTPTGSKG